MGGLITITKKEFLDHISSRKFLLLFGTLLTVVTVSALQAADSYTSSQQQDQLRGVGATFALSSMVQNIMMVGAILAVAISYDLINGERQRGSLKILLSYPVYRDTIINGKFLGGFATAVLVAITTCVAGIGIFIGFSGAPQTSESIMRYVLFLGITVLYLMLFLGIGLLLSTLLTDPSSSLLGALFIWVASAYLVPQVASAIASIIYPTTIRGGFGGAAFIGRGAQFEQLRDIIGLISPSFSYQTTINSVLSESQLQFGESGPVTISVSLSQALVDVMPNIVFLVAAVVLIFSVCYVQFTRQEVS
jgi:ABC-2 type transport system permease protein